MTKWAFLILLVSSLSFGASPEKKTIYWVFYELPGAVNLKNDREPPGYIKEIFNLLTEKMPEYTHQVVEMPFQKIIQQMKTREGLCSMMILQNKEREQFMVFSAPYASGIPTGLIAVKGNKKIEKHLLSSKIVDAEAILKDRTVQIGSVAGRFYGNKISSLFEKNKGAKILLKQGADVYRELWHLLALGRIDAFFGYPFEVELNGKTQFYFVKGNTEIMEPRISCDKSDFGKEVIKKITEVREKKNLDRQFAKIFQRFYSLDLQKEFKRMSESP